MIRTTFVGYDPTTPQEAVAAAYEDQGLLVEHVVVEAVEPDVWRWHLTAGAPVLVHDDVWQLDPDDAVAETEGEDALGLPEVDAGIVHESQDRGWIVVCSEMDDVDEEDLVDEARQAVRDFEAMEAEAAGRSEGE